MKSILTFFAAFIVIACQAQTAQPLERIDSNNTLLWEISGNGVQKPSYLFGTFHLLCPEDIHLSDQLKSALRSSDTVYMEMKMDDPAILLSGMMYMTMGGGKTLKDFYTADEYQRLEQYFKDSLKTAIAMFQSMKPYFLISFFYPKMMDCQAPSGVEMELMKLTKEYGKYIKGLETIQFQASVFDSIPYEWQAEELIKNIDSMDMMKAEFRKMVALYNSQNLDSLNKMLAESDFSDEKYGDHLLGNRNRNWAKQLDEIMKSQSVFVAVGAGHLPGDEGVIQLLRRMGYMVNPLKNE